MTTTSAPTPHPLHGVAAPKEPSRVALLPETVGKATWRFRWQLAPAVGGVGVLACGLQVKGLLALPLLTAAGLMETARRQGWKPRGRMWLSARERQNAAEWLMIGGAWTLAAPFVSDPRLSSAVLAAGIGRSSYRLAMSRMPKRRRLSAEAQRWLIAWNQQVALYGPDPVLQSHVDRSTITEPAIGAVVFEVQLRDGVHAAVASADQVRQQIEVDLKLPVDTLRLVKVRSDSTRMQVLITPTRHLETSLVPWPGPVWENRRTILARSLDGQTAYATLADDSGIRHCLISGTTGAGKSRVLRALVLPWVANDLGVLVLLDGGGGTSCPELAPAAKVYAIEPDEWRRAVRSVYAVYQGRKLRRGRLGLTKYLAGQDDDKTIVFAADEAGAIGKYLTIEEHDMVLEMLQQGRKLGIVVIQAVQDPMADEIIGGRKARDLLGGGGTVVALRAGGSMASRLTLDSQGGPTLDLTALPDVPGSAWMTERGKIVTGHPVRLVDAHEDAAGAVARKVTVGVLCDSEEEALLGGMEAPVEAEPEETAAEMEASDTRLLEILAEGPKRLGEIVSAPKDGEDEVRHPQWEWSRKTASKAFLRLSTRELVEKSGDLYSLVKP